MNDIIFLAELSNRSEWSPSLAIGATIVEDRDGNIISVIETGAPETTTYWNDWGGTYEDIPALPDIEILLGDFLQQVDSVEALYLTLNSYHVDGFTIYTNTEFYPWQYKASDASISEGFGFSSAPTDELNPSNDRIENSVGVLTRYPSRLSVPSSTLNNKLGDVVSGINISSAFNFTINNADGAFDDADETNFFNTPARILKLKTDGNPQLRSDYNTIRYGLVDNMSVNSLDFTVKSASIYRTLDDEVCRTFSQILYPTLPDNSSTIGKPIPVLWGDQKGVPLFEVGTDLYVAIDSDYQTAVTAVYDSDGVSIPFTVNANGTIDATDAKTADVSGSADNKLGEIIVSEIASKSGIAFTSGSWDTTEVNIYLTVSPVLNLYFKSGTVKSLIKECLKSDMAFLVEKNDGRLTIRQWARTYTRHEIPSTMITKRPSRTHQEQKYFTSSVSVGYDYNVGTGEYDRTELNDLAEDDIFALYKKRQRLPFLTTLTNQPEAEAFASSLLDRFRNRSELWKVDVGVDLAEVNVLDTVQMDIKVVDRNMSKFNLFKVIAVNAAQDTMTLESIGTA